MKKYWALSLAGPAILLLGWMCVAHVPPGRFAVAGSRELNPGWHLKPFWHRARFYAETVSLQETLSLRTREGAVKSVNVAVAFDWNRAALIAHPSTLEAVRAALHHPSWAPGPSLRREIEEALAVLPVTHLVVTVDMEGELPEEVRAAYHPTRQKVVFLGLDAMDWILMDRLIAEGRMPTFAALKREGAWAQEQSVKPMLSPLLWTSIATSRPPEEHGILEFITQDPVTGERAPITSRFRKVQAFWDIFSAFGLRVNVVGWWATFPAERINGTMVTERLFFHLFGIETPADAPGNTYPAEAEKRFKPLMTGAGDIPYEEAARYLHLSREEFDRRWAEGRKAQNPLEDPVNHMRKILAVTKSVERIGMELLKERADVTAIYFEGPDTMGHRFAHMMAPRLPWVSEHDFEMGKDALPRYYEEVDRITASLRRAADPDALWIIASDHGFYTGNARPSTRPDDFTTGATDWHRQTGVLILNGPGIKAGEISNVSIYDLLPTMSCILGIPASREWKGRVLAEAFTSFRPPPTIASYEFLPTPWKNAPSSAIPDAERVKELQALGYIGGSTSPPTPSRRTETENPEKGFSQIYNEANSLYTNHDVEKAMALYRRSIELNPEFSLGMLSLGLCYAAKKDPGEAYTWYKKSLDHPEKLPPNVLILLAEAARDAGRASDALAFLRTIRPAWEKESVWFAAMGLLEAAQGNEDEAERWFGEALRLNPADSTAAEEMLQRHLQKNRPEQAAELLKGAWDASEGSIQTMNALGVVCLRNGQEKIAEEIFRKVLQSDPANAGLQGNLAAALQGQGRLPEAARQFESAIHLQPSNAQFHFYYGLCLAEMGRLQESLKSLQTARDLDPANAKILTALGRVYLGLHRNPEARETLRKALALDPHQTNARRMLETLH